MKYREYKPGDYVVYRKVKHTTRPGPRARFVSPSRRGEDYTYFVDKFWLVVDRLGDCVVLQTRRGKRHVLPVANGDLRHAGWWDMLVNRSRFPSRSQAEST